MILMFYHNNSYNKRKRGTTKKNVLEPYITNAVVFSAVLEYCTALEMWNFTQPGNSLNMELLL